MYYMLSGIFFIALHPLTPLLTSNMLVLILLDKKKRLHLKPKRSVRVPSDPSNSGCGINVRQENPQAVSVTLCSIFIATY